MFWLLIACTHRAAVPTAVDPLVAVPSGAVVLPGLQDVACDAERCLALLEGGRLVSLPGGAPGPGLPSVPGPVDTLRWTSSGWEIEVVADDLRTIYPLILEPISLGAPRPADSAPPLSGPTDDLELATQQLAAAWNLARAKGWRTGFERLAPLDDGVALTYMPGMEAGTLARLGGAPQMVRVPGRSSDVRFPGWLAMHPTGQELYLVTWPAPKISALDPKTLASRWFVTVEGAAQGLLLDPSGRWLVVGRGPATHDQLVDWELPALSATATADPYRDEVLREMPRPPMEAIAVIDASTHEIVVELPGSWRRLTRAPGGRVLVATDSAYAFLGP